jgi:hypothetical protein
MYQWLGPFFDLNEKGTSIGKEYAVGNIFELIKDTISPGRSPSEQYRPNNSPGAV